MALFDPMKEKPALAPPVAQTLQPTPPSIAKMPETAKAQSIEVGAPARALMEKATQHLNTPPHPPSSNDNPEVSALMQKQSGQDKTQAAMSPTTEAKGQVSRGRGRSL